MVPRKRLMGEPEARFGNRQGSTGGSGEDSDKESGRARDRPRRPRCRKPPGKKGRGLWSGREAKTGDPGLEGAEIQAAGGADPHPGRQVEQPGGQQQPAGDTGVGEGPGVVVNRLTQSCSRGAQVPAHCVGDKDEAAPWAGIAVPPEAGARGAGGHRGGRGRGPEPHSQPGALLLLKVRGSRVNRQGCSVLLINASGKTFKGDPTPPAH